MTDFSVNVDDAPMEECPFGDLRIRINRVVSPSEVWQIEGHLVHYEVAPDALVKLYLVPTYNVPHLDEAARRAILTHPATALVALPILRSVEKKLAECRAEHLNCEFKLNFLTAELEEELAQQRQLVEQLRNEKNDIPIVGTVVKAEPALDASMAPAIDADLLVEVQKQLVEARRQLEESRRQEEHWRQEHRLLEERRKLDARKLEDCQIRLADIKSKHEEAVKELVKANTEVERKEEDCEERLRMEKEKVENIERQCAKRIVDVKKSIDSDQTVAMKQLRADQKKTEEDNMRLKGKVAALEVQREGWEQKRAREASGDLSRDKRSRPDMPPPHVLRPPPPPPSGAQRRQSSQPSKSIPQASASSQASSSSRAPKIIGRPQSSSRTSPRQQIFNAPKTPSVIQSNRQGNINRRNLSQSSRPSTPGRFGKGSMGNPVIRSKGGMHSSNGRKVIKSHQRNRALPDRIQSALGSSQSS